MYSNLRFHGGSNHLFLPTSLLQLWFHLSPQSVFSGGWVRVERSNSTWLNSVYPNELTSVLTGGSIDLLKQVGHSGRFFQSELSVLGGPELATWAGAGADLGATEIPAAYTIPAYELKRRLVQMREIQEPFLLQYTHLQGAVGDEAWRRSSAGRTVELFEDSEGGRRCRVLPAGTDLAERECSANDIALAPLPELRFRERPLEALFGYWQTWNSVQIIGEDLGLEEEVHCFGG